MKKIILTIKWHFFWWFNYFVLTYLLQKKGLLNDRKYDLEQWGSVYGGWYIPYKLLKKNWTYYLVGVGDDISFDLRLVERVGAKVHLFDPTPESIQFMKQYEENKKIKFYKWGIWNKNTTMNFASPMESSWTSYSLVDLQGTGEHTFKAKCKRIKTVMKNLKHKNLNLLKMDISGAEYEVLEDLFASDIYPNVLLVEFDQPAPVLKTYKTILTIIDQGYDLATKSMWDFTFIKK